ncbi:MAG: hypothetical protein IJ329_01170 [Clostridia bacterium]|nr:hypothetical protein [Clostridia bacterium]
MKNEIGLFEGDLPEIHYDEELEKRCAALYGLRLSLKMFFVKTFKGKQRFKKFEDTIYILTKAKLIKARNGRKKALEIIEDYKQMFSFLPQTLLNKVDSLDDLFFGEYSKEAYEALKSFFIAEREELFRLQR